MEDKLEKVKKYIMMAVDDILNGRCKNEALVNMELAIQTVEDVEKEYFSGKSGKSVDQ